MDLQPITYMVDGQKFVGYLADGSAGKSVPGVLVAHEGGGLTQQTQQRTRMLAELGYVAFALDLFGEAEPALDRAKTLVKTLTADTPGLIRRCEAALDLLRSHPNVDRNRMAAIGFCFGGAAMLEFARSGAPLACVVGFHPGLTRFSPADASGIRGMVLVCLGADDPVVTPGQLDAFVAEMSAARIDWQMLLFGGVGHSFTNPDIDAFAFPGFGYDKRADERSWRTMRSFLDEAFAKAPSG